MPRVVTSFDELARNIVTYREGVRAEPRLAARIKQHPAWYAVRDGAGGWMFGPSKFIGYAGMDTASYLGRYDRKDGKETEQVLRQWFTPVDPHTALGRELRLAFEHFAAAFGKVPNARWRVSVPTEELAGRRGSAPAEGDDRIVFDPLICGGRPHIRGTRIRVGDIVAALGEGETVDELLSDYPYLTREDIAAALRYAARAVNHRVLAAA